MEAFDRVVGWSRSRYKRKFTDSSVQTLRSMLTQIPEKPLTGPFEPFDRRESFPPLPEPAVRPGGEIVLDRKGKDTNREQDLRHSLTLEQKSPKENRDKRDSRLCSEQIVKVTKIPDLYTHTNSHRT